MLKNILIFDKNMNLKVIKHIYYIHKIINDILQIHK